MALVVTETAGGIIVAPFAIQANHPRMSDLYIQSIPGCRLRSTVSAMRPGPRGIPLDQARTLSMIPEVPGMILAVNPAKLAYQISDPLVDDPELQLAIGRYLRQQMGSSNGAVKGVPKLDAYLDVHRIKTLVREMVALVKSNEATLKHGSLPDDSDTDMLPGKFLLNPGSRIANQQPVFEADWDDWLQNLVRAGG